MTTAVSPPFLASYWSLLLLVCTALYKNNIIWQLNIQLMNTYSYVQQCTERSFAVFTTGFIKTDRHSTKTGSLQGELIHRTS